MFFSNSILKKHERYKLGFDGREIGERNILLCVNGPRSASWGVGGRRWGYPTIVKPVPILRPNN